MDEIEIPQYFTCPISLEIMKDPVTAVTGITYDRESIEQWLSTAEEVWCPVTKLPLSKSSGLTPNHMLRRLIQAWCVSNAIDRIPTPKSPLRRSAVVKLIRGMESRGAECLEALRKLEEIAGEGDESDLQCMAEAGAAESVACYVMRRFELGDFSGVDVAVRILRLIWSPTPEIKRIVDEDSGFLRSILWILSYELGISVKSDALILLKNAIEIASSSFLEKLELHFFEEMVRILKLRIRFKSAVAERAVLEILLCSSPAGRNRRKIVEAGAVFELIEMEMASPERRTTELIFCLLAELCGCAEGRQEFLRHAGGVAVVAKRLLRVSALADDGAVRVYDSIARFAATRAVVAEMLAAGGVTKLCMILQADCDVCLKRKAREILKMHSKAWSNSPCIQIYLLTRHSR